MNEDQTLAIAQVSQKVDRVSSEISQTVSQGSQKCPTDSTGPPVRG